jgi:two-component system, NtrC family, response regulator HydG
VKTGADDYLSKPFTDDELLKAVNDAFNKLRARRAVQNRSPLPAFPNTALIGESEVMRPVIKAMDKAMTSTAPVLILGERGTGKEMVARAIHYASPRASAPFLIVNCTAIPEHRLGTELFGAPHEAETSGLSRAGLVLAAQGGTLFIDEIAAASPSVQASLMRLVRDKRIPSPGAGDSPASDARIIAASNKDLVALANSGAFSEDLFYGLNIVEIRIPPLRDRGADVLLLARQFALRFSAEQGRPEPRFSDRTLQVLKNYYWPGNVRELESTVQRLVVMTDSELIDVPDLPSLMRFSALRERGLDRSLAEVESEHIRNVVGSVHGNQTRAAEILGIDRKTLREKMKRIMRATT